MIMEHIDNFAAFQIDNDRPIPAAFNQLQSSIPTTRSGLSEEAAWRFGLRRIRSSPCGSPSRRIKRSAGRPPRHIRSTAQAQQHGVSA